MAKDVTASPDGNTRPILLDPPRTDLTKYLQSQRLGQTQREEPNPWSIAKKAAEKRGDYEDNTPNSLAEAKIEVQGDSFKTTRTYGASILDAIGTLQCEGRKHIRRTILNHRYWNIPPPHKVIRKQVIKASYYDVYVSRGEQEAAFSTGLAEMEDISNRLQEVVGAWAYMEHGEDLEIEIDVVAMLERNDVEGMIE
ncbi:DNA mismatch repair protein mutL [Colletotrichum tabaci]|uniref:DNA mismatch repair protein mutL n=1 Tax=Colletotrichum tabaci TaxID=1209068 RepID=A0AAV9T5V0_9PEZI